MKVGIDLGTTYSLIARMDAAGLPVLMPDASDRGAFHTPSVVHIAGSTAFVGQMAEDVLEQDASKTVIRFFKRQMGSSEPVYLDAHGNAWHAESISALVLKKLRFDAESHASSSLEAAVIGVPAHFTDPQRRAVLSAAVLADIPLLGLVDEPVAAALHYGLSTESHEQVILVYDFGGGTFDATVLSMDSKGVYVLAKAGLTDVGGKELDEAIGAIVVKQFERATGRTFPSTGRSLLELRRAAEDIKIELCMPNRFAVRKLLLLAGQAVEVEISRRDFEAAIVGLAEQTVDVLQRCVREAGLGLKDVDVALLVGGSSMVPLVKERVSGLIGNGAKVLYHEPSKAVAFGTAIRASQLSGESDQYGIPPEFRGVTGYSVGVRALNPENGRVTIDTLVKKNLPLPARATRTYFTTRSDQGRMVLDFVQYRDAEENLTSLGRLVVGPLPSPRLNYPVEVTVECRENGTVHVLAFDAQTGVELKQTFGREDDGIGRLALQRALVRGTMVNNV